jgi:large-conductance mechanosensitive channel
MSSATIVVIAFMVVTLALFVVIEINSRKRTRHDHAGQENQEKEAA